MAARYQRKDAYYRKAKQSGYRSRGAYKLEELLRKLPALRRGGAAVDLGCWPGAWLQVLAERVGPEGRVVGVDLQATEPLADERVDRAHGLGVRPVETREELVDVGTGALHGEPV